jgi:hypothetical protein
MCSSFLTIRKNYVYFIHQSAKDYLTENASVVIFPKGPRSIHYDIFSRSLDALSKTLRRNVYDLQDPGPMTKEVRPDPDPLAPIKYSCVFWLDHLFAFDDQSLEYRQELADSGSIFKFLIEHLLHWIEGLSLMYEVSSGVLIIKNLLQKVQVY